MSDARQGIDVMPLSKILITITYNLPRNKRSAQISNNALDADFKSNVLHIVRKMSDSLMVLNFIGLSLALPTLALMTTLSINHVTIDSLFHPVLVSFTAGSITSGLLLCLARRKWFTLTSEDVLVTKVVFLMQVMLVVQAMVTSTMDFMGRWSGISSHFSKWLVRTIYHIYQFYTNPVLTNSAIERLLYGLE